jgi:hypothetical protein
MVKMMSGIIGAFSISRKQNHPGKKRQIPRRQHKIWPLKREERLSFKGDFEFIEYIL